MQLMIETLRATPIAQRRRGWGVPVVSTDGTVEAELGRTPDSCAELIWGAYSVC